MRRELHDTVDTIELGEHVGDDDHGLALTAPGLAVVPEVDVRTVIEALIGLVEEQHARIGEQGERQVELLARAARQLADQQLLAQREPELGQDRPAAAQPLVAAHAHAAPEHHEVVLGSQQLEQPGRLRAVPDATTDRDRSRVGAQQPGADAQHRGLSGTVLARERDDLAGVHREIDIFEDHGSAEPLGDAARDELDNGHRIDATDRWSRPTSGHRRASGVVLRSTIARTRARDFQAPT